MSEPRREVSFEVRDVRWVGTGWKRRPDGPASECVGALVEDGETVYATVRTTDRLAIVEDLLQAAQRIGWPDREIAWLRGLVVDLKVSAAEPIDAERRSR